MGEIVSTETGGAGLQARAVEPLDTDRVLVKQVFDLCHRYTAEAVSGTVLPVEFLGALTANESGGRVDAACFELSVYGRLKAVATGQSTNFGSIAWKQLSEALQEMDSPEVRRLEETIAVQGYLQELARSMTGPEEQDLKDFATSWGFTQIMGYQVIGRKASVKGLLDPQFHYHFAVEILNDFALSFRLRLEKDFESLFRCWNTGRPDGRTFDPDYVANGIRRMNLYRELMTQLEQYPAPRAGSGIRTDCPAL